MTSSLTPCPWSQPPASPSGHRGPVAAGRGWPPSPQHPESRDSQAAFTESPLWRTLHRGPFMAHWQCLAPTGCPLPSHSALSRHSEGPRLFLPRCGNLLYFLQGPQTFSPHSAPAVSLPFRLSCAPQKRMAGTQKDLQGTRGGTGQVRTEPRVGAAPRTKGQRGPFRSPGPCLPQTGPCQPGPARLTLRKWSQDTRLQHWPKVGTSHSVLLHTVARVRRCRAVRGTTPAHLRALPWH